MTVQKSETIILIINLMNEKGFGFRWNGNKKPLLDCNRDSK
jgi:hypothetical protein